MTTNGTTNWRAAGRRKINRAVPSRSYFASASLNSTLLAPASYMAFPSRTSATISSREFRAFPKR